MTEPESEFRNRVAHALWDYQLGPHRGAAWEVLGDQQRQVWLDDADSWIGHFAQRGLKISESNERTSR